METHQHTHEKAHTHRPVAMKLKVREENWHITEPFRMSLPSSCSARGCSFCSVAEKYFAVKADTTYSIS